MSTSTTQFASTDAMNDAEIERIKQKLSPFAQVLADQATAMNRAILEQSGLESYIDANGKRCYRARGEGAAQKHANHEAKRLERLRHYAFVEREAREWRGEDEHDRHGDLEDAQ